MNYSKQKSKRQNDFFIPICDVPAMQGETLKHPKIKRTRQVLMYQSDLKNNVSRDPLRGLEGNTRTFATGNIPIVEVWDQRNQQYQDYFILKQRDLMLVLSTSLTSLEKLNIFAGHPSLKPVRKGLIALFNE